MQFANLSEFEAVEELRTEVLTWLDYHQVTHKSLAETLKISEQNFCDWLKGRKNLTTETVGKLAYLTRDPLRFARPSGTRVAHVQHFGVKESGTTTLDMNAVRAQFQKEKAEQVMSTFKVRGDTSL
jgi:hypothetical protein